MSEYAKNIQTIEDMWKKRIELRDGGRMSGIINAMFGGQPQSLEYVGYTECPICGDDCAEVWRDEVSGKEYARCPFIGCDGWGKLVELRGDAE